MTSSFFLIHYFRNGAVNQWRKSIHSKIHSSAPKWSVTFKLYKNVQYICVHQRAKFRVNRLTPSEQNRRVTQPEPFRFFRRSHRTSHPLKNFPGIRAETHPALGASIKLRSLARFVRNFSHFNQKKKCRPWATSLAPHANESSICLHFRMRKAQIHGFSCEITGPVLKLTNFIWVGKVPLLCGWQIAAIPFISFHVKTRRNRSMSDEECRSIFRSSSVRLCGHVTSGNGRWSSTGALIDSSAVSTSSAV